MDLHFYVDFSIELEMDNSWEECSEKTHTSRKLF